MHLSKLVHCKDPAVYHCAFRVSHSGIFCKTMQGTLECRFNDKCSTVSEKLRDYYIISPNKQTKIP